MTLIASKRVSSGKYIDLADLKPDDVEIEDIDASLNLIYRFTGHYKNRKPLTVAQHTLLACDICDLMFPDDVDVYHDTVIHDFPEAYTGDVATPLKRLFGNEFRAYEDRIENAVYAKLWASPTPFSDEIKYKRKVCDLLALDIERRAMWDDQRGKDLWPAVPKHSWQIKEKLEMFERIQSAGDVDLAMLYAGSIRRIKMKYPD